MGRDASEATEGVSAAADGDGVSASATLHGVPATPAVRRALRLRPTPSRPMRVAQRVSMKLGRLDYDRSWLTPLQSAREAAIGSAARGAPRVLVRVDEFPHYAGFDDPRYGLESAERFHAVMAEAGLPYLLAVVPQWTHHALQPHAVGGRPLDEHDGELLTRMRADGVTFAQHGTTHRTRHSDPRRHSELGGLGESALAELLGEGRSKLELMGISPRVLVPPFNRFDARQWRTLSNLYEVVTGGPESVMLMGFHGGPQWRGEAIYLPCYSPLYGTAAEVLPAVEELIARELGTWIPVVLHLGWEVDDGLQALRRLAERLAPYAASWEQFLADAAASRAAAPGA